MGAEEWRKVEGEGKTDNFKGCTLENFGGVPSLNMPRRVLSSLI
jgi:hypothetical protein